LVTILRRRSQGEGSNSGLDVVFLNRNALGDCSVEAPLLDSPVESPMSKQTMTRLAMTPAVSST
jgi:hypothetical protein